MRQNEKYFFPASVASVLFLTAIGKLCFILRQLTGSDIVFTGASNPFLRSLPYICYIGNLLCSRGAFVMAVCAIVYAVSYYGIKTAWKSAGLSLGCIAAGEGILFLYNITRNVVGTAAVQAWLLSALFELMYLCAMLAVTVGIAYFFAIRRFHAHHPNRLRRFAPMRAAFLAVFFEFLFQIVLLTAGSVVPFLVRYSNVTGAEILNILYDYGYYILWHLLVSFILAALLLKLLERFTGRLRPKDHREETAE